MKTKDAGFIQKHIEKLVLATGALFLLVIAAYVFIGNPYGVEVNGQKVAPREAESRVRSLASQLEQRLRADDGLEDTIRQRDIPSYAGDFRDRIHQRILGVDRYTIALGMPGLGADALEPREAPDPYYVPHPQIPEEPIARASYGVMGEVDDRNVQEQLNTFMVDSQTRDFRAVSVSATFDIDAYIDELRAQAPRGYQSLPEGWWMAMNGIAGVYLQREERDPATGEWVDRRIIDPLPTQIAYGMEADDHRWDVDEAEYAISRIQQNQVQIIQPPFVPMVGPTTWLPPDQARRELSADEQHELNKINDDIQKIQRNIDRWEEMLRRQGHETPSERLSRGGRIELPESRSEPRQQSRRNRRSNRRGGGVDDMYGPDGMDDLWGEDLNQGSRGRRNNNNNNQEPELYQRVISEMERIRDLEEQRDELYGISRDDRNGNAQNQRGGQGMPAEPQWMNEFDEFDEFGGMDPSQGGYNQRGRNNQRGRGNENTLSGEEQVWAHDLTAQPGRTYRYRVIVTMLNPLFQQRRLHPEQQEEYFNKIALWPTEEQLENSEASTWSDPVTLDPEYYFFLVEGSPAREEAKIEIWRLHRGQWHFEEFDVRPGDMIGGEATIDQQTVSMRVDAMLVDLVSVSEGTNSGRGARMIYLDRETNLIRERVAEEDRDSVDRIRLRNEVERVAELTGRSAGR